MRKLPINHPLIVAVASGDALATKSIVQKYPNIVSQPTTIDDAALHIAASQSHLKVCKVLLENGANPNQKGDGEKSPLHIAASSRSLKIVKLLLQHGANINSVDALGQTPFDIANINIDSKIPSTLRIASLLDTGDFASKLRLYIGKGRVNDAVRAIKSVPKIANSSAAAEFLYLAVIQESIAGSREIVECLLKAGIDPNKRDANMRELPISATDSFETAELLLQHGANPNIVNTSGDSPLKNAKQYKLHELEKVLLRYGAVLRPQTSKTKSKKTATKELK